MRPLWLRLWEAVRAGSDALLHPRAPESPPWKYLPLVLAVAFAARAAVALSGDFVLHPDEIMQYLEPAHRLVFGSGVSYWEFFYGVRSWLLPGLVAGVLQGCEWLGLGEPQWYIGAVKVLFCAISLLIPAGMYFFARHHFSETAARIALLAGACWYELVGFAHKPMTEFVATALALTLLALCVRPVSDGPCSQGHGRVWLAATLGVLIAAMRLQYAPLALLLLGLVFLRGDRKALLVGAALVLTLALGVFDALTWDGGLFHSWLINIRFNLAMAPVLGEQSPFWQFGWWLLLAGAGLSVAAMLAAIVAAFLEPRRYGLLLALIALIVALHSMQVHKEYRFIFVVIPLWLLLGADLLARLLAAVQRRRMCAGLAVAVFTAVSVAGILNALPGQQQVYKGYSREIGGVGFVRGQDPVFAAYRYLAAAPGVTGVWQIERRYHNLPGYYYLHRPIPFYDAATGQDMRRDGQLRQVSVSHIVAAGPAASIRIPGYAVEKTFGDLRIWRRQNDEPPVRLWEDYNPIITGDGDSLVRLMQQLIPDAPLPPPNNGIRFSPAPAGGN